MIKFIFQCIFSFLTIPFDLCWLLLILLVWLLFSCKDNDENFNCLPSNKENGGILIITNTLWKM